METIGPGSEVHSAPPERRIGGRIPVTFKLSLVTTQAAPELETVMLPATANNISRSGALVETHAPVSLVKGEIEIAVPTDGCPGAMPFPITLTGQATIIRIEDDGAGSSRIALRFSDDLVLNDEFAGFIEFLYDGQAMSSET